MSKSRKLVFSTVMCLFIIGQPLGVFADNVDQQIEKASQSIKAIQSERTSVANYKAAMEKQMGELQNESTSLMSKKTKKEEEASQISATIADLTKVIAKRQVVLDEQARSIQIGQSSSNLLETVLKSESLSAAIGNVYAAATIITASKNIVEDQKADVEKNKKLTEQLKSELITIDKQTAMLVQKQSELADLKINQEVRLADLAIELNSQEDKKGQLQQQKEQAEKERAEKLALIEKEKQAEEQNRKAALEFERQQQEQVIKASQEVANQAQPSAPSTSTSVTKPVEQPKQAEQAPVVPSTPPASSGSGWNLPIDAIHISSGFGPRPDPTGISGTFHDGMDFTGPRGTPIYSIAPGKVVTAKFSGMAGNHVIIQHDNGYYSYYLHMNSAPSVSVGQMVGARQYLGPMGTTGNSTGVHLHLGISKGALWSNFIDPATIFRF